MTEKQFENKVKRFLQGIGIYPLGTPEDKVVNPTGSCFKVWGGGYQKAGIPDLICDISGKFVAIELKAQSGKPSELQIHNIKQIRRYGGQGCFLYPSGFKQFQEDIQKHNFRLKEEYK